MMKTVYKEGRSDGSQGTVDDVEEGVGGLVVLRSNPLALEDVPQCLGDVEVRRVRWEEKEEESPFLPCGPQFLNQFTISDYEGTIFGNITKDDLNNIEIVAPTKEKIRTFENDIKAIDKTIELYEQEITKLTELQSLLLARMGR